MKMGVRLQQRMEQRLQLSQQMLQNLELLQMPILALKEKIDQELQENPTLEVETEESEAAAAEAAAVKTPDATETEEDPRQEYLRSVEEEIQASSPRRRSGSSEESDRKQEMLQNVGDKPESLQAHLRNQVGVMEAEPALRAYLLHLIDHIDDNGYLREELAAVVPALPVELRSQPPAVVLASLETALGVLQKLEPRGVGARSRRECLLLQLDEHDPAFSAKRRMIERHLDDIGNNRLPRIVKEVMADPAALADFGYKPPAEADCILDDVKHLITEIGKLNPHPGSTYSSVPSPRVVPEVVIHQVDGRYEIVLEDSYLPPITVNRNYQEMLKEGGLAKTERDYLRQKLDAGRKLISAIEQRRSTIQRITAEILKRQIDFFDRGIEGLRPLKMQEIADAIGIHISTVSRAISEKWIETPRGIFPMKFFFAGAAPKAEAVPGAPAPAPGPAEPDDSTRLSLMEKIRSILDGEDRRQPLSDLQIMKLLKQQGAAAARRTVAKYREELGIPSSRLRRQY